MPNKSVVLMLVYINDSLDHFKAAIESLYSQTYQNFDIYIQEDGEIKPDIHNFLLEELRLKRITYLGIRNFKKGISYSRNEILRKAIKEDYLYFITMDSDDICDEDRISKQINFLEKNKDIDVCGCHIEEFGDGINYHKFVKYPLLHEDMFNLFRYRVPLANVTSVFRKDFFQKAGIYPEKNVINNEDTMLWLNGFINKCTFANVDFIGVRVRVSTDFFNRRNGFKKVISDFRNRITVNRKLKYGLSSYFFAVLVLFINLLPAYVKALIYKRYR